MLVCQCYNHGQNTLGQQNVLSVQYQCLIYYPSLILPPNSLPPLPTMLSNILLSDSESPLSLPFTYNVVEHVVIRLRNDHKMKMKAALQGGACLFQTSLSSNVNNVIGK